MIVQFFIIAGCVGSTVERCLKFLRNNQWYVWKSSCELPSKAFSKEYGGSFRLNAVSQVFRQLGPSPVLEQQSVWLQSEHVLQNVAEPKTRCFNRSHQLPFPQAVIYPS